MTTETANNEEMIEVKEEMPVLEAKTEVKEEMPLVEVKTEDKLIVSKMPSTNSAKQEEWLRFGEKTSTFIAELQNSVADFFKQYQSLLGSLGWILFALITAKITLALLDAINDIPLLSVMLECIGLGYVIWFIYRYLLTATSRQELAGEIQNFQKQVFDTKN
jgi:hypothetical protein